MRINLPCHRTAITAAGAKPERSVSRACRRTPRMIAAPPGLARSLSINRVSAAPRSSPAGPPSARTIASSRPRPAIKRVFAVRRRRSTCTNRPQSIPVVRLEFVSVNCQQQPRCRCCCGADAAFRASRPPTGSSAFSGLPPAGSPPTGVPPGAGPVPPSRCPPWLPWPPIPHPASPPRLNSHTAPTANAIHIQFCANQSIFSLL